ncbi:MAG: Gfo/Idh/MocA family oxidoreductase [Planctomycetes bacterium]|nr:Gfo/Idh/MocA family oxidoreductase [Planctomycetota bacterium]
MTTEYRVGFVGCGGIAGYHANAVRTFPQLKIVACADISQKAVDKFAETYGAQGKYLDFNELFEKEKPDLAVICTWPPSHAPATIAAARNGVKGILCEKPMCRNLAEADAMIQVCGKNIKLAIGHQRRFSGGITEAKRLIAEGAIGKPTLIRRHGGGGLSNTHTHSIDAVRYILGDPATDWVMGQVERRTDRYERSQQIEDLCLAHIAFVGGARLTIESDMPVSDAPENTFIYGTDGILDAQDAKVRLLDSKAQGWQDVPVPKVDLAKAQIEEFLNWIEGKGGHRGEAKNARAAMEIMMAVYESVRTKGLVRMPLQTRANPLDVMIEDGTLPVTNPGKYDIRIPGWLG